MPPYIYHWRRGSPHALPPVCCRPIPLASSALLLAVTIYNTAHSTVVFSRSFCLLIHIAIVLHATRWALLGTSGMHYHDHTQGIWAKEQWPTTLLVHCHRPTSLLHVAKRPSHCLYTHVASEDIIMWLTYLQ